ncbi:LysR family transcriptional regulator ArgP [Pseudorhodobacter wandonensis]|jgi:LysR family transcriptional regulator (chromosome initiation inhibitor)|uniref:LysR family transcriptional regulator ArgP n=1 Tax=Pseudorhodobacter wandonensis TaxID=1120568 RepID=UPI00067E4917|nr:LysR family transcriptional regulator ArgP [Pseudorhodobacter wandonensis]
MFDYSQLAALAAIHRRGSFDLAAASLSVTPSAISQRLKALEERMGSLLIRRGQPCTATPPGLRLIRHFEEVMLLEASLGPDLPQGPAPMTIRIAVNADSLATWVLTALAATQNMLFDLVIDDQDHSQDWLRRGEVSAAITSHPGPLQGCDTLPLGALRYRATASPEFVARWLPEGISRTALTRAPALTFSDKDRLQRDWIATQIGHGLAFPTHRIASSQGFVDAALLGLGWGMNPELLIANHLAAGRLVEIAPNTPLDVPLYWQFARLTAAAIAPLTHSVKKAGDKFLL